MIGLFDSSLEYPTNQNLSWSGSGLYLLLICFYSSNLRSGNVLRFISELIIRFLCAHILLDGRIYNHGQHISHQNEVLNEGDMWSMEVDLRSGEKEKRTLHWFVRGKQQKGFIKGVPDRVEFGVCYFMSIVLMI